MSDIITELNRHLAETKQRFDELEHAMIALADLVEQLIKRNGEKNKRPNRKDFLDATEKRRN